MTAAAMLAALAALSSLQAPSLRVERLAGLVVESVEKTGLAAAAGMRPGDRLVAWRAPSCPGANVDLRGGTIGSTLDLLAVEREESVRCPVTLDGWRGRARVSFALPDYDWGIRTRPVLGPRLLAAYEKAEWQVLANGLRALGRPRDEI